MPEHFLQEVKNETPSPKAGKIRCALNKKREAADVKWRDCFLVMKTKNILLTLSLAAFAIGFSDLQENIIFWSGRPIGAILFVLYMIFLVLEEPSALFDQQEKEKLARINGAKNSAQSQKQNKEASAPALTMAPSR